MPGRYEPLAETLAELRQRRIARLVCLAAPAELDRKAPEYAAALREGTLPCAHSLCAIPDYGIPADSAAFISLAKEIAGRLRQGEAVLVHCGAGIGRTGMFAACALLALGVPLAAARRAVASAGAGAETPEQHAIVDAFAHAAPPLTPPRQ
jgi:protein-tyrosine phosphatase